MVCYISVEVRLSQSSNYIYTESWIESILLPTEFQHMLSTVFSYLFLH
jgi:hypothetical protein